MFCTDPDAALRYSGGDGHATFDIPNRRERRARRAAGGERGGGGAAVAGARGGPDGAGLDRAVGRGLAAAGRPAVPALGAVLAVRRPRRSAGRDRGQPDRRRAVLARAARHRAEPAGAHLPGGARARADGAAGRAPHLLPAVAGGRGRGRGGAAGGAGRRRRPGGPVPAGAGRRPQRAIPRRRPALARPGADRPAHPWLPDPRQRLRHGGRARPPARAGAAAGDPRGHRAGHGRQRARRPDAGGRTRGAAGGARATGWN